MCSGMWLWEFSVPVWFHKRYGCGPRGWGVRLLDHLSESSVCSVGGGPRCSWCGHDKRQTTQMGHIKRGPDDRGPWGAGGGKTPILGFLFLLCCLRWPHCQISLSRTTVAPHWNGPNYNLNNPICKPEWAVSLCHQRAAGEWKKNSSFDKTFVQLIFDPLKGRLDNMQ